MVSGVVSPVKPVILPHGIMPVVTVPVSLITKVSAVSPILRIENTSPAIERRTMRGVIPGAFPIPTFPVRVLTPPMERLPLEEPRPPLAQNCPALVWAVAVVFTT